MCPRAASPGRATLLLGMARTILQPSTLQSVDVSPFQHQANKHAVVFEVRERPNSNAISYKLRDGGQWYGHRVSKSKSNGKATSRIHVESMLTPSCKHLTIAGAKLMH